MTSKTYIIADTCPALLVWPVLWRLWLGSRDRVSHPSSSITYVLKCRLPLSSDSPGSYSIVPKAVILFKYTVKLFYLSYFFSLSPPLLDFLCFVPLVYLKTTKSIPTTRSTLRKYPLDR